VTDPTLTLAFILSCGLNVVFYARWRRAERQSQDHKRWWHAWENDACRYWTQLEETKGRLADTEAALHAKVAAETRGGDGPVAA
jgi:hypothetical protein